MPLDDVIGTILAEAAGEGEEGMYAVASVIANRAKRRKLTPSQVVNQKHQFSGRERKDFWEFVGRQSAEAEYAARRAWQRAQADPIPGLDHYVTTDLYNSPQRPAWLNKMGGARTIGNHIFFDSTVPGGGSSMNPVERQIRRMNDLAVLTGFSPLKAEEIEPVLARLEPRRSINRQPDQVPQPSRALPTSHAQGPMAADAMMRTNHPLQPGGVPLFQDQGYEEPGNLWEGPI